MDCINKAPAKGKNPRPDESDVRVFTEDEDTLYAKAFYKCLTELAAEVYGIQDPFEIAQRTLRTACEFYEADWCGMFDADMMLDLWMPFWWYNRLTGGMTTTQLEEGHVILRQKTLTELCCTKWEISLKRSMRMQKRLQKIWI